MKPFDDWPFVSFAIKCLWLSPVQCGYTERNNLQNAKICMCLQSKDQPKPSLKFKLNLFSLSLLVHLHYQDAIRLTFNKFVVLHLRTYNSWCSNDKSTRRCEMFIPNISADKNPWDQCHYLLLVRMRNSVSSTTAATCHCRNNTRSALRHLFAEELSSTYRFNAIHFSLSVQVIYSARKSSHVPQI